MPVSTYSEKFRKSLFWIFLLLGGMMLATVFISDEQWLSETVLSASLEISILVLWLSIFSLPFMFYFDRSRGLAVCITEFDSYVFGITLWFMGVKLTYSIVGPIMVMFGLMVFGIGCIPFAFFLTWFLGRWNDFEILAVLLVLCVLCRVITHLHFMNKARQERESGLTGENGG